MPKIIIICFVILSLCGCSSVRAIESARNRIDELTELNEAGTARNLELEGLYNRERESNKELGNLLSGVRQENQKYIDSERNRLEAEKRIIDNLSGIFEEGKDIIEGLIRGYHIIREYFEAQEPME